MARHDAASSADERHPAIDDEAVAPQIPRPLGLTAPEREALVAFPGTLTDPGSELDPELLRVPTEVPSGLAVRVLRGP